MARQSSVEEKSPGPSVFISRGLGQTRAGVQMGKDEAPGVCTLHPTWLSGSGLRPYSWEYGNTFSALWKFLWSEETIGEGGGRHQPGSEMWKLPRRGPPGSPNWLSWTRGSPRCGVPEVETAGSGCPAGRPANATPPAPHCQAPAPPATQQLKSSSPRGRAMDPSEEPPHKGPDTVPLFLPLALCPRLPPGCPDPHDPAPRRVPQTTGLCWRPAYPPASLSSRALHLLPAIRSCHPIEPQRYPSRLSPCLWPPSHPPSPTSCSAPHTTTPPPTASS